MYRYGPGDFHDGPGVLGWLLMAALVALVVLGIIALVRTWGNPGWRSGAGHGSAAGVQAGPPADPALHELRVRYARGDITWDEYALRAAHLGYPVPPGPSGGGSPPPGPPTPAS